MPPPLSPVKVARIRTLRIDYDPNASPSDPTVIRGKFTVPPEYDGIVARCNRGGPQCTVCKATFRHDRDGRAEDVALKIVSRHNAEELIAREIRAWRELRHSRVLPLYGHCTLESHVVLISPWMKRGNLLQHVRANPDVDRQELLVQAADGLVYLHDTKGLVHGDIKAENVLITQTGDVLLADFGLTTHVEKSPNANTTATDIRNRFTLRFCAPEMFEDNVVTVSPSGHLTVARESAVAHQVRSKSLKTDVYAFGMLMLQTFTGVHPWHDLTEVQVIVGVTNGELPPIHGEAAAAKHGLNRAYWAVCQLCWSKKPCHRPTMAEVRKWLDFHRDGGGDRILTSPTEQDDSTETIASPSTPISATSSEASGPKKQPWIITKVRQQFELQDGDSHIPWYGTHARKSSKSSSSGTAVDAASEEMSPKDKHPLVKFGVPKKAIKKASVVVPVARAATRQLWQALREHFELYEGQTDAGYYPYQWKNLANPTLEDEDTKEESPSSEPMQRTETPDAAPNSFLDL